MFYYFPFVSYESSWQNPWPPGLATAVLVGKAFGNAYRTLGLDEGRGRWVVEEDFHANIRVFMLHGCKKRLHLKFIRFTLFFFVTQFWGFKKLLT